MTGLVEELQEIVAKLMQFPDLSVQDEFDISGILYPL